MKNEFHLNNLNFIYDKSHFRKLLTCGGTELIRGVYPAVRDRNWGTVPFQITDEKILKYDEAVHFSNLLEFNDKKIVFHAKTEIILYKSGNLDFIFDGLAGCSFLKNRIGWNILLPIEGLAGCLANVKHNDGSQSDGLFPVSISPNQPILDIASMHWTDSSGNHIKLRFDGDIFEMEDQRNWTDASYKIYSTPLSLPYPVTMNKGDRIYQKIEMQINATINKAEIYDRNRIHITGLEKVYKLPLIGLQASSEKGLLDLKECETLQSLGIDFSGFQCDLLSAGWKKDLENHFSNCARMNCKASVSFLIDKRYKDSSDLLKVLSVHRHQIDAVEAFDKTSFISAGQHIESFFKTIAQNFPAAEISGGTYAYYAELNRAQSIPSSITNICFSICPQVHSFDDLSLVESLKAQYYAVRDAKEKFNKPVVINALTLKQRMNFVATSKKKTKKGNARETDLRQPAEFNAVWTLGAIKNLIFSGAAKINLFETAGQRGLMQTSQPLPGFGEFPETPLLKYPVFYLIREICSLKNGHFSPIESDNEEMIDGFLYKNEIEEQLWLWNYSEKAQEIHINSELAFRSASILDLSTGKWLTVKGLTSLNGRKIYRYLQRK